MKNTARNKQIFLFAESRKKTVKTKMFFEKAEKAHRDKFLDINLSRTRKINIYYREYLRLA